MAQVARKFTYYAEALTCALEEEFMGEGHFQALADHHDGSARQAFLLMAAIERAVIVALEPAICRNGLQLRDPEALRAEGRAEAEQLRGMTWSDFLDHVTEDYPAFLHEFEQVARLAPPEDVADAQLLIDHEIALIDFAAACQRGDADSLDILAAFLARVTHGVGAPADAGRV